MIVCQCAAVSDRDVVHAIREGAETVKEICRRTGAGMCCGSCRRDVVMILRAQQSSAHEHRLEARPRVFNDALVPA